MPEIKRLTEYTPEVAEAVRGLLVELSRSGKDRGEIPKEWFLEVIDSPYHDLILATNGDAILGMAVVSVTMGAIVRKNVYLEDFVVTERARGQGVGGLIWDEILRWGQEKGAGELEFTSGEGREAAWQFYLNKGAEIYKTNFFKKELHDRN
ncbi:GNAT family N-acetyltransferase [Candidatus Saccharibacteria bacterium]|nr:GNAT family N-acetyltransferase [Candidatus Saccharibacteria bacterium]MBR3323898.1 GNAT family N-acetyltransferase [Candidatus Saccharibacteria bacterium]